MHLLLSFHFLGGKVCISLSNRVMTAEIKSQVIDIYKNVKLMSLFQGVSENK